MNRLITQFWIMKALVGVLVLLQLVACGGGGGGGGNPAAGGSTSVGTGATQTSKISLSWVAPVTRTDGTPITLAEIEGYKVYIRTSAGSYTDIVDITDGSQTSATITGLSGGAYHVAMTTYDNNGIEGPHSPEIIKTAQ